jgi:hypothetical protein
MSMQKLTCTERRKLAQRGIVVRIEYASGAAKCTTQGGDRIYTIGDLRRIAQPLRLATFAALVNGVMAGEDMTPRHLLESDRSRTPAELAERAAVEKAQQLAAEAGLPHRMNSEQGLRSLRAALQGA